MRLARAIELYAGGPGSGRHKELGNIANKFRSKNLKDCSGKNFCSEMSRGLVKHLQDEHGISGRVVNGLYRKPNGSFYPHSWVRVGDTIIDPTADQFGKRNVVVTDKKDSSYIKSRKGLFSSSPDKPFSVIDSKYGFLVSRWGTYEEANKAATMRPYSKVVSSKYVTGPGAADTRKVRP